MALTTITGNMVSVNAIQGTLIADNAITAVHIATNAVSGTLIADNAVTAVHIAQNSITVTQLADDCVESDKIADGVITTNHLNNAMISSQTEVTAVAGDFVLLGDTSDSNNLKKTLVSSLAPNALPLAGGTMTGNLVVNAIVDADNFKINNAQGTDGQVLTSTGSGVAWEDAAGGVAGIVSSADATAITIDSSERVGIGRVPNANGVLQISVATNENCNLIFSENTDEKWLIGNVYTNDDLRFINMATSSEKMRILSGGGITFNGDTAAANALDDYEEGTWTPAYLWISWFSRVTTRINSTAYWLHYTKIGNIVHIHAKISVTLSSLPGQTVTITGLPFAAALSTQYAQL